MGDIPILKRNHKSYDQKLKKFVKITHFVSFFNSFKIQLVFL